MSNSWIKFFRNAFEADSQLHPLDHSMAKRYVKQRLGVVFPELQNNPIALEKAYQTLNLEPRIGIGKEEAPTIFEMTFPG